MNAEKGYHYQIVKRAIAAIDAADGPLSLESLAKDIGLSPAHFQRVFSAWAGISPKRYQQYLMLGHAKNMLSQRHTTFETAASLGLSGTSRLHDLFIRWEAMSPGTFGAGGDVMLYEGWFDSPFGPAIVIGTERGICGMGFASEMGRAAARQDLLDRWPLATVIHAPERLQKWVTAAFRGQGIAELVLIGTPLQIKVWEALINIPSGYVTTYSDIAVRMNKPKAVRAVGTAVGRNPISWIIPCHRALRKSGALGGYHWGLPLKRAMLAYESARIEGKEICAHKGQEDR